MQDIDLDNDNDYYHKYLKYKRKYLELQQEGGLGKKKVPKVLNLANVRNFFFDFDRTLISGDTNGKPLINEENYEDIKFLKDNLNPNRKSIFRRKNLEKFKKLESSKNLAKELDNLLLEGHNVFIVTNGKASNVAKYIYLIFKKYFLKIKTINIEFKEDKEDKEDKGFCYVINISYSDTITKPITVYGAATYEQIDKFNNTDATSFLSIIETQKLSEKYIFDNWPFSDGTRGKQDIIERLNQVIANNNENENKFIWGLIKVLFILYAKEKNQLNDNIHFFDDTDLNVNYASKVIKNGDNGDEDIVEDIVEDEDMYEDTKTIRKKVDKLNKLEADSNNDDKLRYQKYKDDIIRKKVFDNLTYTDPDTGNIKKMEKRIKFDYNNTYKNGKIYEIFVVKGGIKENEYEVTQQDRIDCVIKSSEINKIERVIKVYMIHDSKHVYNIVVGREAIDKFNTHFEVKQKWYPSVNKNIRDIKDENFKPEELFKYIKDNIIPKLNTK